VPGKRCAGRHSRAEQPDHSLARLIFEGCNPNETWSDLITNFVASALLHGNGAIEQATDDRGKLAALTSIAWPTVTPWAASDGSLSLDVLSTLPPNSGQRRRLAREDFALLKDRGDNSLLGVSRLSRAANSLQLALLTQAGTWRLSMQSLMFSRLRKVRKNVRQWKAAARRSRLGGRAADGRAQFLSEVAQGNRRPLILLGHLQQGVGRLTIRDVQAEPPTAPGLRLQHRHVLIAGQFEQGINCPDEFATLIENRRRIGHEVSTGAVGPFSERR
jgi:hypothetical protein